jgi:hypothetical protein
MQKITLLLFCCFIASLCSYSQNSIEALVPQLPGTPTPAAIPQYNNSFQPKKAMIVKVDQPIYNQNRQQAYLLQSPNNRLRKEQDKRQALYEAMESIDRLPVQRTVRDADLDTVFGNRPVVDQSTYEATKFFWDALVILTDMSDGKRKFSLTEAIYTVENAYLKDGLNRSQFYAAIEHRADLAKQIMKNDQLDTNDNLAKNYAIQKQFEQANKYKQLNTDKVFNVPRLEYDFYDFMGDSSHTQMFVSKLLATGKGQCHSMPLLYLAIAEQLKAKAFLSLAPEHSFIRFSDNDGSTYNYETTNGAIVNDNWMLRSGYINTAAIKNKIYLDTLSEKQLLALCIYDLAMGYIHDHGYDGFTETALKHAMPLDPNGIQGNIMLSNFWAAKTRKAIGYQQLKTKEQFEQNAVAKAMQRKMLQAYDIIDRLGYQKMPSDVYAAWLLSVNEQKEKQNQQMLQQHLQYLMKKNKVTITPNKK